MASSFLSRIWNNAGLITGNPAIGAGTSLISGLVNRNRNLPNNGGQYQSSVVAPTAPAPTQSGTAPVGGNSTGGGGTIFHGNSSSSSRSQTAPLPDPHATADAIYHSLTAGDIPTYSGAMFANPNPTSMQAQVTASELNNARNDIATGTTDPYHWASQSGIPYTAAEMKAIESATAGIYDPAINSALARLDQAQKQESERLKSSSSGASGSSSGDYVEGQNPVADSWIQRISRGEATLGDIKGVSKEVQALRNAVNLGLNSLKYRNATAIGNLSTVDQIDTLLKNPALHRISGPIDQKFGGVFGKAKTAKTDFEQITSKMQLAASQLLKGQGAVSNFERDILEKASTNLNRGLSDKEFKNRLVQMKGVFQNTAGLPAKVKITDPSTGESDIQNLTTEEINDFRMSGANIEYVQ